MSGPYQIFDEMRDAFCSKESTCVSCGKLVDKLIYHCWPGIGAILLATCEECMEWFIKSGKKDWVVRITRMAIVKGLSNLDQANSNDQEYSDN